MQSTSTGFCCVPGHCWLLKRLTPSMSLAHREWAFPIEGLRSSRLSPHECFRRPVTSSGKSFLLDKGPGLGWVTGPVKEVGWSMAPRNPGRGSALEGVGLPLDGQSPPPCTQVSIRVDTCSCGWAGMEIGGPLPGLGSDNREADWRRVGNQHRKRNLCQYGGAIWRVLNGGFILEECSDRATRRTSRRSAMDSRIKVVAVGDSPRSR